MTRETEERDRVQIVPGKKCQYGFPCRFVDRLWQLSFKHTLLCRFVRECFWWRMTRKANGRFHFWNSLLKVATFHFLENLTGQTITDEALVSSSLICLWSWENQAPKGNSQRRTICLSRCPEGGHIYWVPIKRSTLSFIQFSENLVNILSPACREAQQNQDWSLTRTQREEWPKYFGL